VQDVAHFLSRLVVRKIGALLGSFVFLLIAPGTVVGVVPWIISGWRTQPAVFDSEALRGVGIVLIGLGIIPLLESFARFAWKGLGTPAPIAPTKHLVVSGFYRYVRNPMYVGVVTVILGQALLFGDVRLLFYGAAVWLATHLFVVAYEEPSLRRKFGEDYATFCRHVPRWLPRLRPRKG
jgi:protein-S-isoprenylcysteine O-methyltransferase Ste14